MKRQTRKTEQPRQTWDKRAGRADGMVLQWWFSDGDRLRNSDQRVPAVGETHTVAGVVVLCERGLHSCRDPLAALNYAPGCTAWLVWAAPNADGQNKGVGEKRVYVGRVDARQVLVDWAQWCADRAAGYASAAASLAASAAASDARDASDAACAASYARDAAFYARDASDDARDAEWREQNLELTRRLLAAMGF